MSVSIKWILISNCLLLLTLLTASCSKKISADDLTKELENVTSWAATAHMVGDAWKRGEVPKNYAQQTLKTAQKKLQEETDTLSKSSIATSQRQAILKPIQQLQKTISQMSTDVERQDHKAIATQLQSLSTQKQTIQRLAKQASKNS